MERVLFENLVLCDNFQKSIFSVVSEKESSTTYSFPMFLKVLLQLLLLFQGQLVEISGDETVPTKIQQWIPSLVVSSIISKNKLVHRRYPSIHGDKY